METCNCRVMAKCNRKGGICNHDMDQELSMSSWSCFIRSELFICGLMYDPHPPVVICGLGGHKTSMSWLCLLLLLWLHQWSGRHQQCNCLGTTLRMFSVACLPPWCVLLSGQDYLVCPDGDHCLARPESHQLNPLYAGPCYFFG